MNPAGSSRSAAAVLALAAATATAEGVARLALAVALLLARRHRRRRHHHILVFKRVCDVLIAGCHYRLNQPPFYVGEVVELIGGIASSTERRIKRLEAQHRRQLLVSQ